MEMTPKSEPAEAEVKKEADQDSEDLSEERRRSIDGFHPMIPRTPLDLNMWQMSCEGSPQSFHQSGTQSHNMSQGKGPQPREHFRITVAHMHP